MEGACTKECWGPTGGRPSAAVGWEAGQATPPLGSLRTAFPPPEPGATLRGLSPTLRRKMAASNFSEKQNQATFPAKPRSRAYCHPSHWNSGAPSFGTLGPSSLEKFSWNAFFKRPPTRDLWLPWLPWPVPPLPLFA